MRTHFACLFVRALAAWSALKPETGIDSETDRWYSEAGHRLSAMSPTYISAPPGDLSHHHYNQHPAYMPLQPQQYSRPHMQAGPSHYPPPTTYYPGAENGEYSYSTPIRPSHAQMPPMTYNGAQAQAHAGPGPSSMSGRPMDGPMSMPPHAGGQSQMWAMATPTKAPAPAKKRGRPPKVRKEGEGPVETPQKKHQHRTSTDSGGSNHRPQKRAKKDSGSSHQLPTPPTTADAPFAPDLPVPTRFYHDQPGEPTHPVSQLPTSQHPHSQLPTPQALTVPLDSASTVGQSDSARPATSLAITRDADGRKLEFGGASGSAGGAGGEESAQSERVERTSIHPPRYVGVPSLVTNDAGVVYVDNHNVLESDMAWLDNAPSTPRTTPADSTVLHTPIAQHEHDAMLFADVAETPATKTRKADKRMEAFNQSTPLRGPDAASAALSIARIGRVVAVSQISNFLGIDSNARATQETDMRDMFEVPAGTSASDTVVKPNWPEASHWSSVKGSKQLREEKQRAAALHRYFESASEESSDDDTSHPGHRRTGSRSNKRKADRLFDMSYRQRTQSNVEAAMTDASYALLLAIRGREVRPVEPGVVGCICGTQDTQTRGSMIRCEACKTWSHLSCYRLDQVPHAYERPFWCQGCQTRAMATATPVRAPRDLLYTQSEERSSALKRQASDIALAPSPIFPSFNQAASHSRTPLGRAIASVGTPGTAARARMLSYNDNEFWAMYDDTGAAPGAPSTPNHHKSDRFSTPKVDEVPFDVMSTPSRGVGFDFGQASFFSLTPLNGRGRVPSGAGISALTETPFRPRNVSFGQPLTDVGPSRSEFFRDLNRANGSASASGAGPSGPTAPHTDGAVPASPSSSRWGPSLLGAQHLSPSPFGGHRRTASGNKMSSLRSSSKAGAGLGFGIDDDEAVQEDDEE